MEGDAGGVAAVSRGGDVDGTLSDGVGDSSPSPGGGGGGSSSNPTFTTPTKGTNF